MSQLKYIILELATKSDERKRILQGNTIEHLEEEKSGSNDINETFFELTNDTLGKAHLQELYVGFLRNRTQEAEMKTKAAQDDGTAQKKKKQAPTSLGFGTGTRKFFDYLLLILEEGHLKEENWTSKLNILINKEIDSLLDEIL